jgi:hypothetical protein
VQASKRGLTSAILLDKREIEGRALLVCRLLYKAEGSVLFLVKGREAHQQNKQLGGGHLKTLSIVTEGAELSFASHRRCPCRYIWRVTRRGLSDLMTTHLSGLNLER